MKLTKRVIDHAKYDRAKGSAHYLWDRDLAGFGVRVYPSGRKSFVVAYRAKGRQRFHTLGRFGEMTVQQARGAAIEVLARVRRGEDPSGDRQAYRRGPTVADLAERYMREHARPKKKPSSVRNDEQQWRNHVLPVLGKRKVADVSREDVSKLHGSLESTPYAANRVLALLSKAFNLAEVWGWRPDGSNPCRHVQKYREQRRERFLSVKELTGLAAVLNEAEREGREQANAIAAIRLLIFTGCRVGEILRLKWSEIDFERRCLRLSDSKTGQKIVHLNSPALEVLAGLERVAGNPYALAGGKSGMHLVNLKDPWRRLRKAAGLEDVRIHDLRHSWASFAAGSGLSLPVIGKLLGHTQASTTQRYAHLAADPLRQATERVGAEIAAAMNASPRAEVEDIRRWRPER